MRKRKFGGRRCIGVGRVQNDDPALGSGGYVDIVNPDAGAADDLSAVTGGDHGCGYAGLGAHDDSVVVPNALSQLRFVQSRCDRHLKSRPREPKGSAPAREWGLR